MKYKIPLIIIIILYGILIPLTLLTIINPSPNETDITPLIPGKSNLDLPIMFMLIIPLGAILGSLLGYFLAPLFLLVHKKTVGRSFSYGIQERSSPKKFKRFFRGFFPGLMAINFGLMLSSNTLLVDLILTQENMNSNDAAIRILVMLFLLGWTLGVAFALFSSAWILMEAGIVYNNKDKLRDSDYPIEVHAVGGWYLYLLKGYAGISVIFSLYLLSSELIVSAGKTGNLALVFTLIFFPFFISILTLPAVVLFDCLKAYRNKNIRKFASKLGIFNFIELEIREIQK